MDYKDFIDFMKFEIINEQKDVEWDADAQGNPLKRISHVTVKNDYCVGDIRYKTLGDGAQEMVSANLTFHG
jgi:uncharacterized protein YutD